MVLGCLVYVDDTRVELLQLTATVQMEGQSRIDSGQNLVLLFQAVWWGR